DAGRLVRLLRVDGRPWRVVEAGRSVALVEGEQWLQRLERPVDRGPRVTSAGDPSRHGGDRELVRRDVVELVPGERRGHLRADAGAHGPRAEDRLVRGVMVEVD